MPASPQDVDAFHRALAMLHAYDEGVRSREPADPAPFEHAVRSTAAKGTQALVDALSGLTMIAWVSLGRLADGWGMTLPEVLRYASGLPVEGFAGDAPSHPQG